MAGPFHLVVAILEVWLTLSAVVLLAAAVLPDREWT